MKKKIRTGIVFGMIAGIIDVIPMIIQNLTWDANLSAFSLWVVAGFMISTNDLRINGIFKGMMISLLILLPSAIIIGWHQPVHLIPIFGITLLLGGLLGSAIQRFGL